MNTETLLTRGRKVAQAIEDEIGKVVFGSEIEKLKQMLVIALYTDSHLMVRAHIGFGKTTTLECFAHTFGGSFRKIQFTADTHPNHIKGHDYYNQRKNEYEYRPGLANNAHIVLVDEFNRAPAETQSALLEIMQERRVVVGNNIYHLNEPFLVVATRNPIEYEGTHDVSEAVLDRFIGQATIPMVSKATLLQIVADKDYWRRTTNRIKRVEQVTNPEEILAFREAIYGSVEVSQDIDNYIADLVLATWEHKYVRVGSSPRAMSFLRQAATIVAFRNKRYYVIPDDVERHAVDILAHRIFMTPEGRFETNSREIIAEILKNVRPT